MGVGSLADCVRSRGPAGGIDYRGFR